MSNFGYSRAETGFVDGFAFRGEDVKSNHDAAWASVADINRKQAVIKSSPIYGSTIYDLSATLCADLEPLQKLVLANGSPSPFGGTVRGMRVEVYND